MKINVFSQLWKVAFALCYVGQIIVENSSINQSLYLQTKQKCNRKNEQKTNKTNQLQTMVDKLSIVKCLYGMLWYYECKTESKKWKLI